LTATKAPVGYRRISRFRVQRADVDTEVVRNIDRQLTDNTKAAEALNLGPLAVDFKDDNRSASQFRTKERDAWLELLEYVRKGNASHVVVWLFDRAARTTEDTEALLAACRTGGALIVQSASMDVADPHNPDDIFRLKLSGLLAEYEVAKMALRQRRAKRAAAEAGKAHGGRRAFGYNDAKASIREDEAEVVRDLASRFLQGESLHSLAKWLNTTGVPSASGNVGKWTGPNLRHLLKGPHLAGLRVHGRDEAKRPIVVTDGTWDPIIPVETHHHLVAMLNNPDRRTNGGTNDRKWLGSGLYLCDACGAKLQARPRTGRNEVPAYRCPTGRHVQRSVEHVDAVVEGAIVGMLARHDNTGLLVDDEAASEVVRLRDARAALDARMSDLVDAYTAGDIPAKVYGQTTTRLEAETAATDEALRVASAMVKQTSRVLDGATGEVAAHVWETLPLSRRRSIIGELAEVRLVGGRGGNHRFNPDDVVVEWR
jgi:DNA invertase Pin-like site-specific DNA recombinase